MLRKKQIDIEPLGIIYLTTYNKAQGDMRSLLGIQSECGVGVGIAGVKAGIHRSMSKG